MSSDPLEFIRSIRCALDGIESEWLMLTDKQFEVLKEIDSEVWSLRDDITEGIAEDSFIDKTPNAYRFV